MLDENVYLEIKLDCQKIQVTFIAYNLTHY